MSKPGEKDDLKSMSREELFLLRRSLGLSLEHATETMSKKGQRELQRYFEKVEKAALAKLP